MLNIDESRVWPKRHGGMVVEFRSKQLFICCLLFIIMSCVILTKIQSVTLRSQAQSKVNEQGEYPQMLLSARQWIVYNWFVSITSLGGLIIC